MLSTDSWISLTETESTNSLLMEGNYPSGTMVTARRQSAGRGRQGRVWNNTRNQSFLFSLLLEFDTVPAALTALPLIAGLCVLEAAEACLKALYPAVAEETHLSLKWPNDILLMRGGMTGKVAGILLESRMEREGLRLVTGIGLNWSAIPQSVETATFMPVPLFPIEFPQSKEPEQFIVWLLTALNQRNFDRPAFTADMRSLIESRFYLKGKQLRGSFGTAVCESLADNGALQLRTADGKVVLYDRTDEEYEIL